MLQGIQWGSLRTKIITWSFVPTVIILAAVAWVTFSAYQQVTEDSLIERHQRLTHLSASEFSAALTGYTGLLTEYTGVLAELARTTTYIYEGDPAAQRSALQRASGRFEVFDGGVLIFDNRGMVVAAEPARPDIVGQNWSNRSYFRRMLSSPGPVFSDVVPDGPKGAPVIVIAVPIRGDQGQFVGVMAGLFRLGADVTNTFYDDAALLLIGGSDSNYLVDGDGRVVYHSDPGRIGDDFSTRAAVAQISGQSAGTLRVRAEDGRSIVLSFAPVPGTPWSVVAETTWAALIRSSRGNRQFLLLLLVLGVVVPAMVVAVGVRRITRPITDLIGAAQEVAGGNFGQKITARTGDEIEELAEQFNLMSAQLQETYAHLERRVADRTKELEAINAIAAVVSRSLDLEEILNDALDKTLQVMEIGAGGIYLLDEEAGELTVAVHRGFSPELVAEIDRLRVGEGFSGHVVESGQPMVVGNVSDDPRLTRMAVREAGLRSMVSVPLSSKGRVLGTLFVVPRFYRKFTDQDVQLLTSIGHQIGVAIENARLYEQAQQLAIVEERNRLARELHDAVTQTLFSASLIAEALPALWEADQEEGRQLLEEIRRLSRGALAEMRTLLLELRPATLIEASLEGLLRQLAEAVNGRTGIPVAVTVDGQCDLPSDVHVTLYRIAQEALNNVVKHAGADRVTISLRCSASQVREAGERCIELCISDDGCGFDPGDVSPECLGLGIMHERAQTIGATLSVESQPDAGTRVVAVWKRGE